MKNKRSLWVSLLSVIAIAVIALTATLASGWSPKLGLDLDGGLSVVYQTHTPVNQAQLDTIVTILNNRVDAAGPAGPPWPARGRTRSRCRSPVRRTPSRSWPPWATPPSSSSGPPSATRRR